LLQVAVAWLLQVAQLKWRGTVVAALHKNNKPCGVNIIHVCVLFIEPRVKDSKHEHIIIKRQKAAI
jgi:hypothetical protein